MEKRNVSSVGEFVLESGVQFREKCQEILISPAQLGVLLVDWLLSRSFANVENYSCKKIEYIILCIFWSYLFICLLVRHIFKKSK